MRNEKIITLAAAAALTACLALVGCGSSQVSSSSTESSASESAESSAVESSSEDTSDASADTSSTESSSASHIGDDAAKEIALKDAGVAEADCTELEVELDTDDAVVHYDVDFKAGGMEYDYEIDAATGSILKGEAEIDD